MKNNISSSVKLSGETEDVQVERKRTKNKLVKRAGLLDLVLN